MFDAETAALIREAPPIRGVDPATLPQDLTRAYAELVALRLRRGEPGSAEARELRHDRLLRMASVYEALVDTAVELADRRGAAFVAGTAFQILGRVGIMEEVSSEELLSAAAIHPDIAAPLLFLIAGQSPDAREAGRRLRGARSETVLISALLESLADLAAEDFEEIVARAERLVAFRPTTANGFSDQATQALYGLCWTGVVQMASAILDREMPRTQFQRFDRPEDVFLRVESLATEDIELPGTGGQLVSTYPGPRHLARLLRRVASHLAGTGVATLPPPAGADGATWRQWVRHRAKTKPVIWPNHRPAIDQKLLNPGVSGVLVLPTGAGKTTLSELKIAGTLAAGRKVIFLVPTLALVDQLRDDLAASFPPNIGGVVVSADGDLAVLAEGPELRAVEVMTPERFLALLSFAEADVSDVGLIVFDECHLLSPRGGGSRSVDAMLCVLHAAKRAPTADFLLLSAMLTNGEEVAGWLGQLTSRPSVYFQDSWKPSRQARGVVMYPRAEFIPIYRYIQRRAAQPKLKPPPFPATAYALFGLQQNWAPDSPTDTKLIRLLQDPVELKAGQRPPAPNANAVASTLAERAAATGLKTIVFVQQAGHAPSTARRISDQVLGPERVTPLEQGLLDDLAIELGDAGRSLVNPVAGAVPHNGDMLPLERRLAESLFRRPEGVNVIVATPTLAQGINLPAQLAIMAGDKRHYEDGREDLEAHEILNAAGRAGRAGHLANGTVLLIPEPVVGFDDHGPSDEAFGKLRTLLPDSDRCVRVDDPLELVLDRIHLGQADGRTSYLVSRLKAGNAPEDAAAAASALIRRSFGAYRAAREGAATEARYAAKIAALEANLGDDAVQGVTDAMRVSAFSGLSAAALASAAARLANPTAYPATVLGWVDWIVDFLRDDPAARALLFDGDDAIIRAVVRGKQTGGPLTAAEFETLRAGLTAWLTGHTFERIEAALGVPANKVRCCERSRDLVLKIVNRRLYMIAAAIAELAKARLSELALIDPYPAILEILAYAVRSGFDTPEKLAFSHEKGGIRTRVGVHRASEAQIGAMPPLVTGTFRDILQSVRITLAFDGASI